MVVGLGGTGLSCARYLYAQQRSFTVVDSRLTPPGLRELNELDPSIPVELGAFNESTLLAADELIVSPGVSLKTDALVKAKQAGIKICGDIALFSKAVTAPIIAVTGSNGKSTVVAMIAEILEQAGWDYGLGGNLDGEYFKPALELLAEEDKAIYVLELSSFQLETTDSLAAEVAVLLNVSEDHMDRYTSMDEYQQAKQRIFNGCKKAILNSDLFSLDDLKGLGIDANNTEVTRFGLKKNDIDGYFLHGVGAEECIAFRKGSEISPLLAVNDLLVVGRHNISNALAAAAATGAAGIPDEAIARGLKKFSGLPHRCQFIGKVNEASYYNDSKATNVGATLASLLGIKSELKRRGKGRLVWIAGGSSKNADFLPLLEAVDREIAAILLIGDAARELQQVLANAASPVSICRDIEHAVQKAAAIAQQDDSVLLAPACASFDKFENYRQRGRAFVAAVEALQ